MIDIVLSFIAVMLIFGIFGFFIKNYFFQLLSFTVVFVEMVLMLLTLYQENLEIPIAATLKINFTVIIIIITIIGLYSLFKALFRLINPADNMEDSQDVKWLNQTPKSKGGF